MAKARIRGSLNKILPTTDPKMVSLELLAYPKSRWQFMRACGGMWDKMGEEGLAVNQFLLRLSDFEPVEEARGEDEDD